MIKRHKIRDIEEYLGDYDVGFPDIIVEKTPESMLIAGRIS